MYSIKNNETSEDVLDSVKNLFELAKVNISDVVIDLAHTIGLVNKDHASGKSCKVITVRFMTFRHRTILYRVSSKSKGVKVGLDLKKCLYDPFCNANNHVKEIPTLKFCYLKFIGEDLECFLPVNG